jgi:hypothetical protein
MEGKRNSREIVSRANRWRFWTLVVIILISYLLVRFGVDLYTD